MLLLRSDAGAQRQCRSPQLSHAVQELFPAELALRGRSELPCHHEYADTGWVQSQVITKLLDPIDTYLILILGVCRESPLRVSKRALCCNIKTRGLHRC